MGTTELLTNLGWEVCAAAGFGDAMAHVRDQTVDAMILPEPQTGSGGPGHDTDFANLLRLVDMERIAALVVSDRKDAVPAQTDSLVEVVGSDITLPELRGRFAMIERYHGLLTRVEKELRNMERLGKRLNQHFREVDQEMRLAARLQRDFLPRVGKPIRNAQFATIYRPATWVSGDIFDIFRIDERHTGFYVADAVGHGMAASLLTMFIKRAIVPKHIAGKEYTILSPAETMASLNDALAAQSLPNCQFVTACYAVLDHETLKVRYARGGHPYPLLIARDGAVNELKSSGGLLGLFPGEEFPTFEAQLNVGDKLLLYTDGVELAFPEEIDGGHAVPPHVAYRHAFRALAPLPVTEMVHQIEVRLDREQGSLNPVDDVTIVGLEILNEPDPATSPAQATSMEDAADDDPLEGRVGRPIARPRPKPRTQS